MQKYTETQNTIPNYTTLLTIQFQNGTIWCIKCCVECENGRVVHCKWVEGNERVNKIQTKSMCVCVELSVDFVHDPDETLENE